MKKNDLLKNGTAGMPTDLLSEYLNVKELMAYLKIGRTSVWRYTNAGILKPRKIGGKVLFMRSDIDSLFNH